MPSRAPPKAYQVLLKSHRLTIFLTVHQSATIAQLKEEAYSALTSNVLASPSGAPHIPTAPGEDDDMEEGESEVPRVGSTADFELCRAVKDKSKPTSTITYGMLDPSAQIKGLLSNWETLYIQFRDEDGQLMPVEVSQPSLLDEDEEEPRRVPPVPEPEPPMPIGKGKRKAPPE